MHPPMKTLRTLFLEELADRYDGEQRLVKSIPAMIDSATCSHLKELLAFHLRQTESHVTKLEEVFTVMGEEILAKKCQATIGLLKEGEEVAAHYNASPAINAALISIAQKIEHYEIASYSCLHEWAEALEELAAEQILQQILDEENDANNSLIDLARSRSNVEAIGTEIVAGSSIGPLHGERGSTFRT
jgi:ferritin-like metal-binding protein YciE